jgi:ATP-dependent RNA helicase RhlB
MTAADATGIPRAPRGDPRVLIIAPTRELAIQIERISECGAAPGLKSALIYGGVDYDKQRDQLRGSVDIIIATPGACSTTSSSTCSRSAP